MTNMPIFQEGKSLSLLFQIFVIDDASYSWEEFNRDYLVPSHIYGDSNPVYNRAIEFEYVPMYYRKRY